MKKISVFALFAALVTSSYFASSGIAQAATTKKVKKSEVKISETQTAKPATAAQISADSANVSTAEKNAERHSFKTEGHFVGLDLVFTDIRFHERYTKTTKRTPINTKPAYSDYGFGGGLSYKYAFNFNNFFIAPGVFAEKNNATARGGNGNGGDDRLERIDIRARYGLKADIGYDITNRFAPYLTGGYSRVSYTTQNYNAQNKTFIKTSNIGDWFYGAGFKVRCSDHLAFNLEYNRQSFLAQTEVVSTNHYLGLFKTNLNIVKAGLSYNF